MSGGLGWLVSMVRIGGRCLFFFFALLFLIYLFPPPSSWTGPGGNCWEEEGGSQRPVFLLFFSFCSFLGERLVKLGRKVAAR